MQTYLFNFVKCSVCMVRLEEIVAYCDERTELPKIKDYPQAFNGLQFEGHTDVSKIGAAVDAGLEAFKIAAKLQIDFLIVHHGLFWEPPIPLTGVNKEKVKLLLENEISLYSAHLPLDAHLEIGNNIGIARALQLKATGRFMEHEGVEIGLLLEGGISRVELRERLKKVFPTTFKAIEYGAQTPRTIAVCSGSGSYAISDMLKNGVDTLITGELRQHHYNIAQEKRLNLYPCGHYATEVFGVKSLAQEVSSKFNLNWEFIPFDCPL